ERPGHVGGVTLQVDQRRGAGRGAPHDRIARQAAAGAGTHDVVAPHGIAEVAPVQIGGVAYADDGSADGEPHIERVEFVATLAGETGDVEASGAAMERAA